MAVFEGFWLLHNCQFHVHASFIFDQSVIMKNILLISIKKKSLHKIYCYFFSKAWVAKVQVCNVRSHVCVRNDLEFMCAMCVRADTFKLVTHHTRATTLDNQFKVVTLHTLYPHFL